MRRSVLGPPLLGGGYGWVGMGSGAAFDRGQRTRSASRRGVRAARRLSLVVALRGALAVLFGVSALVWPGVTVLALALLFAAYAVVDGAGMIASGLNRRAPGGQRWLYLIAGITGIAAGLIAAAWPQITALVLVLVAGVWALTTGAFEIAAAVRWRRQLAEVWPLAVVGIVSMLAGLLILLRPIVGVLALATVLGIYALITGVVLLVAAWLLRKTHAVIFDGPTADL